MNVVNIDPTYLCVLFLLIGYPQFLLESLQFLCQFLPILLNIHDNLALLLESDQLLLEPPLQGIALLLGLLEGCFLLFQLAVVGYLSLL